MIDFPLQLSEFIDLAKVRSSPITPSLAVTQARRVGGGVSKSMTGDFLWKGQLSINAGRPGDAEKIVALAEMLLLPGATFMTRDTRRIGPIGDPDGAILGSSVVTLQAVSSDSQIVTFGGLPSDYPLQAGDWLSFTFGANTAFHKIAAVDGGSYVVNPPLHPGYALGAEVRLIKPEIRATIDNSTFRPPSHDAVLTSSFSFEWVQFLQ